MLRWIDELNGVTDADDQAKDLKKRIRSARKLPSSPETKREIRRLYGELDRLQFKPDYMCLIIDKVKDYRRACDGFFINGIRYKRLLGTNGGIKNSTIVFVSERLWPELTRRIENGRNPEKALVTAKLEAYKALTCSASTPVSFPKGILVVPDAKTEFLSDIIFLTDECDGEPIMEEKHGEKIEMNASDGFGLMLPSLAERWSGELGLGYVTSGMNTRFSFEKGVLFTFDYIDFAEKVAGTYIVKDVWGNDVDVRETEAILTESMVKLWDSYESCADYVGKSLSNGYTFGVTKTCPETLENERSLNYQYIQPFSLTPDDIEELIAPTLNEFHAVLHGDWKSAVLFLKGCGLNADNVTDLDDDFIKAMMISPEIHKDPFVQNAIYQLIRNRINEAKVGVLKVHGNYSIISGDPYLLCQNTFGLEKTGLLGSGEIYNEYWADNPAIELTCYRSPMSTKENIRRVIPARGEEVRYWFRYMRTCTVLNAWDTMTAALNGCDFDGDLVFLTDNPVLLRRFEDSPALVCAQRKAEKRVSSEEDFIQSNIDSFGNEIGQTTNYITSMYEVQAGYPAGSEEYRTLAYRIRCGQLYQQNVIDKAKGIVAKPMPKEWHDRHAVTKIEDPAEREFYASIAADRKPYFMRYIYPDLMREYNTYSKKADKNALREFGLTVRELEAVPEEERTEAQNEFLYYYNKRIPVGTNVCVMNRICKRFEEEFDGYVGRASSASTFNPSVLKSGADYTDAQTRTVKRLYTEFCAGVKNYWSENDRARVDKDDAMRAYETMLGSFTEACHIACGNEKSLCDLLVDICYKNASSKRFAWQICGSEIIDNLLSASGRVIRYPVMDENGDFAYCGEKFRIEEKKLEEENDDRVERERMGSRYDSAEDAWEETI